MSYDTAIEVYRQIANSSRTIVDNKIAYHSDVVEASPVGAAPTTSSISSPGLKRLRNNNWKTGRETFKL